MKSLPGTVVFAAACLALVSAAPAATIHVPADYSTIQQGINASQPGDTIEVGPGVYHESLVLPTGRTLTSSSGAQVTAIDGDGINRGISIPGGPPSMVEVSGFTIQNAYSSSNGGGICVTDAAPTIANNIFESNQVAGYGAAIYATGSNVTITKNEFHGCHAAEGAGVYLRLGVGTIDGNQFFDGIADHFSGAIYLYSSSPTINQNLIVNCSAGSHAGGINIVVNSAPIITNNTIAGCSAQMGGGITFSNESGIATVTNNIVVGCGGGYGLYNRNAGAPPPYVDCNDVWNNVPGDYFAITPWLHDISVDPLFCDPAGRDFRLMSASPCAPDQQPYCGLIGAFGVGCGATSVTLTTWGRVKGEFYR